MISEVFSAKWGMTIRRASATVWKTLLSCKLASAMAQPMSDLDAFVGPDNAEQCKKINEVVQDTLCSEYRSFRDACVSCLGSEGIPDECKEKATEASKFAHNQTELVLEAIVMIVKSIVKRMQAQMPDWKTLCPKDQDSVIEVDGVADAFLKDPHRSSYLKWNEALSELRMAHTKVLTAIPADKGSPYREACEWSTGMSDDLSKLDGDVGTNTGIAAFLDWHRKYVNDKTIDDAKGDLSNIQAVLNFRKFFVPKCVTQLGAV
jgi:hypothetical protein